ncbi:hypothetical protein [Oceanidesulfovibrio marinus]|uniref:Uncharacterized protein n=1 Tax=Oceanidesulfovibrio marinus TaxID=370038 RepID=A0A6P1ZM36_9BACT|nr:hypothetical protein [Oceanidesulfovibrio marinus]TVM36389.1 hypothetical protein DQK91_00250 [Oceanidesulfovibrio marinus]
MSDEGRRVIKMESILALMAGKSGGEVSDLLAFLTQRDLNAEEESVVQPLAKAWLMSKLPGLIDVEFEESEIYEKWIASQSKKLGGDNVSIAPIPESEMAPINVVLDTLRSNDATIKEQAAKVAELEAKVEELEPYVGKAEKLEKEVEQLNSKIEALEAEKAEQAGQIAEFAGKLPVAEDELNDTIKDIVTKALKDAVASVPVGAAAGAAAEAGEANAAVEPEAEEEAGVPDDFGFGSSGADGGGFGF